MKKILLIIGFSSVVTNIYAESVDYSKGNTNPFYNYQYKTPNQQAKIYGIDYFTNEIENPLVSESKYEKTIQKETRTYSQNLNNKKQNYNSKPAKGKYKYLIENQYQLKGCWESAAKTYGLDPWLLMSIAKVESSFNNKAINTNKNKSSDFGMMQINDIWLPTLKKFGIQKKHLFEPCTSVHIGAWILAQNIRRFGYNQDGIGAYNSPGNKKIRRSYAAKVYKAYEEITHDLYFSQKKN